jgi:hypothetical protein
LINRLLQVPFTEKLSKCIHSLSVFLLHWDEAHHKVHHHKRRRRQTSLIKAGSSKNVKAVSLNKTAPAPSVGKIAGATPPAGAPSPWVKKPKPNPLASKHNAPFGSTNGKKHMMGKRGGRNFSFDEQLDQ